MKNTSLKSSQPQFELNALAPLRLPGLVEGLRENADNPIQVHRIANEIEDLIPHILELLIVEGEKTAALMP